MVNGAVTCLRDDVMVLDGELDESSCGPNACPVERGVASRTHNTRNSVGRRFK